MHNFSEDAFHGYVAGLIDGEGSILIHAIRYNHYVRIVISNTHIQTLEAVQKRLGFGTIRLQKKYKTTLGTKDVFVLDLSGLEKMEDLLKKVGPFLSIKKDKAEAAIAIIAKWRQSIRSLEERNRAVRAAIEAGIFQAEIATEFGLSQQAISTIKLGHLWPSRNKRKSPLVK